MTYVSIMTLAATVIKYNGGFSPPPEYWILQDFNPGCWILHNFHPEH